MNQHVLTRPLGEIPQKLEVGIRLTPLEQVRHAPEILQRRVESELRDSMARAVANALLFDHVPYTTTKLPDGTVEIRLAILLAAANTKG